MINRIALTASALAVLAVSAHAQFLSFADNGTLAANRTNAVGANTDFATAGTGYTGVVAPIALTSLSFSLSPVPVTATSFELVPALEDDALIGTAPGVVAGTLTVTDSVLGKLFDVDFDFAELTANNFGADDFTSDNVVYKNVIPALQPYIFNNGGNAFSFGFTNPTTIAGGISYSVQGQFSSNPVPEPASMVALGLGAAAMIRRRRKA